MRRVPNVFTIPIVVSCCAELLCIQMGQMVHSLSLKLGPFVPNSAVGISFVYIYSKCGNVIDGSKVFVEMELRDVVAWTALIVGYVQNEESDKGLGCLHEMHKTGEKPNFRTIEVGLW
ncbi:hypothetical protein IFM89_008554 [Coptis chinensis]|uniref:Pentatricopeptide repeat-containing protein n=1 Tax=Coptis chinensis TaxID=261450 RepID=A0A835I0H9_9MAGN|nr:hypothetical protein IFM89_008554 [Coptis chinensis]